MRNSSSDRDVAALTPNAQRLTPLREVLPNGLVLVWRVSDAAPSVALRGSFPAGSAREEAARAGLAGFTARMVRRGTERHTAAEISAAVEDLGASFGVWGGVEEAGFSAKCLASDLGTVLDLLQEVLERPAFPEEEVARTRGELLTVLREHDDSPRYQAERLSMAMLYPEGHPYSRPAGGRRDSIEAIEREDLRAFHEAHYGAQGMIVTVSGAVDADLLRSKLSRWFEGRPAPTPQPERPVTPSAEAGRAAFPMPHKSQAEIVLAGPGIPRVHPDFHALSIVSLILGGLGLMGRLGERVREQQGMAYHVSCRAVCRRWAGEWSAHAGVSGANVEPAIAAILEEIERLRAGGVTEAELEDARAYLIGSVPLRLETNDGVAGYLLNTEYYGLGLDYLDRYPALIRAVTGDALRDAALRYLDPAGLSLAMAGPVGG
jgi:zinc protease